MADRTGLNEGSVELVIKELRDAIIFFNHAGRSVKIEDLGTYTPGIDLKRTFNVKYRADTDLKNGLNARNTFSGTIRYRENIGKSTDDLVALWNGTYPDYPVTKSQILISLPQGVYTLRETVFDAKLLLGFTACVLPDSAL